MSLFKKKSGAVHILSCVFVKCIEFVLSLCRKVPPCSLPLALQVGGVWWRHLDGPAAHGGHRARFLWPVSDTEVRGRTFAQSGKWTSDGEVKTETFSFLCLQLQHSARRLPDDDSGVATRSTSLHGFFGNKAASLPPDDRVAVVLQGRPGQLGGVRTAGELIGRKTSCRGFHWLIAPLWCAALIGLQGQSANNRWTEKIYQPGQFFTGHKTASRIIWLNIIMFRHTDLFSFLFIFIFSYTRNL